MTKPTPELPRAPWSKPIRRVDSTSITVVPVVRHENPHEATSRYVDLFWTPSLGGDAVALLRWAAHQTRPITMTERELAKALGAHGVGQVRKAIQSIHDNELATINGNVIHLDVTLPTLSNYKAELFGPVFASRHRHELQAV